MDIYVSPKIKATVKSVGTIILLLFYSSLVDFYYIGPYIHNTLGQIKYTTEKMLVNGQDIENNFLDMLCYTIPYLFLMDLIETL